MTISNESFLTRDATFAQLTFNLHSGVVRLNVESDQKLSKMRLEIGSDVDGSSPADNLVRIEFKKLTSQMQFKFRHEALVSIVQLAEFTVYDDHTKQTIYPKLVFTSPVMRPRLNSGPPIQPKSSPVFYFSYERTEGIMQRIHCETAPLTVIHNAELLRMAKGFVSRKNHIELAEDGLEVWRQRERYRDLRMGAKRNIKSALDKVLSGRAPTAVTGSQLNITLDLAAPKIIIPQNIVNENSPQILIDFGRLKFSNVHEDSGDGEDEEFFTPESTPPNEGVHQEIFETKLNTDELHERLLVSKLYHKYSINLLDLQILVGNQGDGWRTASSAGKSSMHIVERFNVSLGLERRALDMVADTKYPFAMLSGILPSLTLHLNETKCATLWGCLNQLNGSPAGQSDQSNDEEPELVEPDVVEIDVKEKYRKASKLVYMMFQIERVTVGLASEIHQNQTIAALEISQVKSEIKVSSSHQSCIFSVASVVLADCYQQLGPDFEFILASNSGMYLGGFS